MKGLNIVDNYKQSKDTAIIILNYNSSDDTIKLINSINEKEKTHRYQFIIVDNASERLEVEKLNKISDCEVLLLKSNGGYAYGNNCGISYACEKGYEYILIANSDTEVIEENSITKLIDAMNQYNVSIIGPALIDKIGKNTAGAETINIFGKVKNKRVNKPVICQALIGAFFIIRRVVFDKIGLLKEYYFLYLEETDYFYNVFNSGMKIMYYPYVSVVHYGGTTTSQVYDYYISRNRFILVEDNFPVNHLILSIYLAIEYIMTDIKQFIACKIGIRNYDYMFRRQMRWLGYKDGIKGIRGKKATYEKKGESKSIFLP